MRHLSSQRGQASKLLWPLHGSCRAGFLAHGRPRVGRTAQGGLQFKPDCVRYTRVAAMARGTAVASALKHRCHHHCHTHTPPWFGECGCDGSGARSHSERSQCEANYPNSSAVALVCGHSAVGLIAIALNPCSRIQIRPARGAGDVLFSNARAQASKAGTRRLVSFEQSVKIKQMTQLDLYTWIHASEHVTPPLYTRPPRVRSTMNANMSRIISHHPVLSR